MDKTWMNQPRQSLEYKAGVDQFLDFAFTHSSWEGTIYCPCVKCNGCLLKRRGEVKLHLERDGIIPTYTRWVDHGEEYEHLMSPGANISNVEEMENMVNDGFGVMGWDNNEEPNDDAKKFYRMLEDCEQSLYPGCTTYTKMSFIVELLHLKCLYKVSNKFADELLQMMHKILPADNTVPKSYYEAKKFISDLGLGYEKIHACKNDCVLFRKEYSTADVCPKCGESRWILPKSSGEVDEMTTEPKRKRKKVPVKVLRYFPLTPRLQRYFMSSKTASSMRWHDDSRVKDGVLRHPADTAAWKALDDVRPSFGEEPRNVRLGLATDGFDPFSDKSKPYSMWPVVLIPYNVSPETCIKDTNYLLSMLIPGPKAPTNDIDVYLQPLIDELNELWEHGALTYDASRKENFQMHAAVLWTINDLPAYANLSGYATYGYLACPVCKMDTHYCRLKNGSKCSYMGHRQFLPAEHGWRKNKSSFDGKQELRPRPERLSGDDELRQLENLEHIPFGKTQRPRKIGIDSATGNWKKKSVFFQLPYWSKLLLRHNLDVMHIEKNVCDNLMGILLGIDGKNNDNIKARLDMKAMGIRSTLHPVDKGKKMELPPACHTLSKEQKGILCQFLKELKLPGGYSSNISRCVKVRERKLVGLKSHDYHVLMQRILSVAIKGLLPKDVCLVLIDLSNTFRVVCSKELNPNDLEKLASQLPFTMCNLERIFPPAFFNITVHLIIHLAEEAKLAGPVQFRWMYSIERIMGIMKSFVRNRSRPEGSIAEGYIALECLTFCSRYLHDVETKFSRQDKAISCDGQDELAGGLSIFRKVGSHLGGAVVRDLSYIEWEQCHRYVLNQCEEVKPFIEEHKRKLRAASRRNRRNVDLLHNKEFVKWFDERVSQMPDVSNSVKLHQLKSLSQGPLYGVRSYSGFVANGFTFHTKERSRMRTFENSGVACKADTTCYSSSKDNNPISGDIDYYGLLREIVELQYLGGLRVILFKCDWFNVLNKGNGIKDDEFGFTCVKNTNFLQTDEPFILASQAHQVFYLTDNIDSTWSTVLMAEARKKFILGGQMAGDTIEPYQENGMEFPCRGESVDEIDFIQWRRDDIDAEIVDRVEQPDAVHQHTSEQAVPCEEIVDCDQENDENSEGDLMTDDDSDEGDDFWNLMDDDDETEEDDDINEDINDDDILDD